MNIYGYEGENIVPIPDIAKELHISTRDIVKIIKKFRRLVREELTESGVIENAEYLV